MNHDFHVSDSGSILELSVKSDTIECIENSFPNDVNIYCSPKVDAITVDAHVCVQSLKV